MTSVQRSSTSSAHVCYPPFSSNVPHQKWTSLHQQWWWKIFALKKCPFYKVCLMWCSVCFPFVSVSHEYSNEVIQIVLHWIRIHLGRRASHIGYGWILFKADPFPHSFTCISWSFKHETLPESSTPYLAISWQRFANMRSRPREYLNP